MPTMGPAPFYQETREAPPLPPEGSTSIPGRLAMEPAPFHQDTREAPPRDPEGSPSTPGRLDQETREATPLPRGG